MRGRSFSDPAHAQLVKSADCWLEKGRRLEVIGADR
jgi:hypothetical protein